MSLPALSPQARLPANYSEARRALANCERLDECQQWADKAEALASYAKQAEDASLREYADRIQARAVRRCGELLQQVAPGTGKNQTEREGASPLAVTRKSAAEMAGMSPHQRKQALRVASVPEAEFEAAIERPRPATVTQLAARGTVRKAAAPVVTPLADTVSRGCIHLDCLIETFDGVPELADALSAAKALRERLSNLDGGEYD